MVRASSSSSTRSLPFFSSPPPCFPSSLICPHAHTSFCDSLCGNGRTPCVQSHAGLSCAAFFGARSRCSPLQRTAPFIFTSLHFTSHVPPLPALGSVSSSSRRLRQEFPYGSCPPVVKMAAHVPPSTVFAPLFHATAVNIPNAFITPSSILPRALRVSPTCQLTCVAGCVGRGRGNCEETGDEREWGG